MNNKIIITVMILGLLTLTGCSGGEQTAEEPIYACPDGDVTGVKAIYVDTLSANLRYLNPTVYLIPRTANMETIIINTLKTDGSYSGEVEVPCLSKGTEWKPIALTKQDVSHSIEQPTIIFEGAKMVLEPFEGKGFGLIRLRVEKGSDNVFYDVDCDSRTHQWLEMNDDCELKDNSYTSNSLYLDADDEIDITLHLKANETRKQYGEDGLNTWMIVDAGVSEWQEPEVTINGALANNVVVQLSNTDRLIYNDYEYAYVIGSIGNKETDIGFYIRTIDGVEPSQSPLIEFCSEGRYISNKVRNAVLVGCYSDGTPKQMVSTQHKQILELKIV